QTQIWMNDYNHHRPHDGLNKMSPVEYAKLNSLGASPK
ncbi:integrase core domain-containing protein, partial [Psychroflexus sp. CAK8W]